MRREIIEINSFKEATPKKRTWYKYFDDILVSVICNGNRTSHIRRKQKDAIAKRDNKMCQWHSDWQYLRIEENYGRRIGKAKTYEISIRVDGIEHVIDSLVEKIAIEFQHSLGVSINEMNERYEAHKKYGFVPYLILDFTSYSFQNEMIGYNAIPLATLRKPEVCLSNELDSFFKSFERKWCRAKYFHANNLFVDFKDVLIRLTPSLLKGYMRFTQESFTQRLLNLESELENQIEKDKIKFQKEVDEWNGREKENEEERDREAELLRKKMNTLLEKKAVDEKIEYEERKKNGEEFKYYRKCMSNKTLAPFIREKMPEFETGMIYYYSDNREKSEHYFKNHSYRTMGEAAEMKIDWITISKIKKKWFFNGREHRKFEFQYSEIRLIKEYVSELRTILFEEKNGKTELKEKHLELFEGYLHSFDFPALIKYELGKVVKECYYLFNRELSKSDWSLFTNYFRDIKTEDEVAQRRSKLFYQSVHIRDSIIIKELKEDGKISTDTKDTYFSSYSFDTALQAGGYSEGYKRMVKHSPQNKEEFRRTHRQR